MSEQFKKLPNKTSFLAYKQFLCKSNINVVFLGGYASDMEGKKATYLEELCRKLKINFLRFDYFAHGMSPGEMDKGNISIWLQNSIDMFEMLSKGNKNILIGSSMGGWLSLLVALKKKQLVNAIIQIAPAVDFTQELIWNNLNASQKNEMKKNGHICITKTPEYEQKFSYDLVADGLQHLLFSKEKIDISCPVHILHGLKDEVVPYEISLKLMNRLISKEVILHILKDSGHRMSEVKDLEILGQSLRILVQNLQLQNKPSDC
ncbi:MAG: alpha/beta fold hydrolase [Rickettsiales bacterium]